LPHNDNKPAMIGHGLSMDTMLASARAYLYALNNYLNMEESITFFSVFDGFDNLSAIKSYEKVIHLDSRNSSAYNNLGILLEKRGRLKQAIVNYEKAVKV